MKKFIVVRTIFKGIHNWENCPQKNNDQSFLVHPHHHEFNIEVKIQVYSDDRELEFIKVQKQIDDFMIHMYPDGNLRNNSCEMLCLLIKNYCEEAYGGSRIIDVGVFEDQHYGALIEGDRFSVEPSFGGINLS